MRLNGVNLLAKLKVVRRSSTVDKSEMEREPRSPHQDHGECYILDLPTELLSLIAAYLDPVSRACFALTCRRLVVVCGAALASESLRFQKDFTPLFHHYKSAQSFRTDRWRLLLRLEDGRWVACSRCLKLHPRSGFSSKELRRFSDERTCNLGELAGVIDLCPCKKLTFHDTIDLINQLKTRDVLTKLPSDLFGSRAYDERFLWHSCTTVYKTAEVKIDIFPEINEEGKLIVRTEYRMYVEPHRLAKHQHITPRFACAHRSMDLWLSSVCQTISCHQNNATICSACERISVCSRCETVLKCPRKRPFQCQGSNRVVYYFWTQRCFGGTSSAFPDKEWAAQRTHPVEPAAAWNNCRELCPWTIRMHPPSHDAPTIEDEILSPALENNDEFASQIYSSLRFE